MKQYNSRQRYHPSVLRPSVIQQIKHISTLELLEQATLRILGELQEVDGRICYVAGLYGSAGDPIENARILEEKTIFVFERYHLISWNPLWLGDLRRFGVTNDYAGRFYGHAFQKRCFSHIAMVNNWRQSKGATFEHSLAVKLGLTRIYL